jgi:hypothetical protein
MINQAEDEQTGFTNSGRNHSALDEFRRARGGAGWSCWGIMTTAPYLEKTAET